MPSVPLTHGPLSSAAHKKVATAVGNMKNGRVICADDIPNEA